MWRLALLMLVAGACSHAPRYSDSDLAPAPPNKVTVQIENNYSGTALLRLYLVRNGNKVRLATITRMTQSVTFLQSQRLAGTYLMLEAAYEETWYSQELFDFGPGDCILLRTGIKPMGSGVLRCRG